MKLVVAQAWERAIPVEVEVAAYLEAVERYTP
jgi:hypothetical protein